MTKTNGPKKENFIERVEEELNKLNISTAQKKCILELLWLELKYPTTDRADAMHRYEQIISHYKGSN